MSLEIVIDDLVISGEKKDKTGVLEHYPVLTITSDGFEIGHVKDFNIVDEETASLHIIYLSKGVRNNHYGTIVLKSLVDYSRTRGVKHFLGENLRSDELIKKFTRMAYDNGFGIRKDKVFEKDGKKYLQWDL